MFKSQSRVEEYYYKKFLNLPDPVDIIEKIREIRKLDMNQTSVLVRAKIYSIERNPKENILAFRERFEDIIKNFDPVPQSFISAVIPVIGLYLLKIFNCSISESVFLSVWKSSLVLTYNKVSNPRSMNDIRSISLLNYGSGKADT